MKRVLTLWLILSTAWVSAQSIQWMDLNEALQAQAKNPKPIFMDVYTDWCGPCKLLDKNTFSDKEVAAYINQNFYAVKFNAEGNTDITYKGKKYTNPKYDPNRKGRNSTHQFVAFLKVQGYPSMYVLGVKGDIEKVIIGYYQPTDLMSELKEL